MLAEKCLTFGRSSVALSVPHLSEKLGDIKLKKSAGDTLLLFAEKTSLSFVLNHGKGLIISVLFLYLNVLLFFYQHMILFQSRKRPKCLRIRSRG